MSMVKILFLVIEGFYVDYKQEKRKKKLPEASELVCLLLLLVFSVTPFKIDQNKKSKPFNRLGLESGNTEEGRYAKTLA